MKTFHSLLCEISITVAIAIGVAAFVFLMIYLVFWKYGKLWLQSTLSGVPIPFAEIIGMVLRKTNPEVIVINRIIASKAGLNLSTAQLEAHAIVGGNVSNVVRAMIALDRAGINPGWETLTKEDLQGIDILKEAQYAVQKIREDDNNYND
ncbi:MAG: flotillin-like FloA family protein [Planctomycetota bacterium]|jgi:uncharacterized protein YqfA (UPF0365 family)